VTPTLEFVLVPKTIPNDSNIKLPTRKPES
jgi:hypothetical protein